MNQLSSPALFLLRIFLVFLLISKIFNRRTAFYFIPLFLFDPFTVFSGMQIRSDNLMLLFYTTSLLFLTFALLKKSKINIFFSAFFLCTALITNIKIFPSFFLIFFFFLLYCLKQKSAKMFSFFFLSFLFSLIAFISAFHFLGYMPEIIHQVLIDSPTHINYGGSYAPPGLFYQPYNMYIYGSSGRPITWIYAWVLPILAFIGAYQVFFPSLKSLQKEKNLIKIILFFSLTIQWLAILFIKSAYIQYYLLATWLFALFAAVFVDQSLKNLSDLKIFKTILAVSFYLLFLALSYSSIKNNLDRAKISFERSKDEITSIWSNIPENEKVFPGYIFHPLGYPVIFGNPLERFPPSILQRFPPPLEAIKKNKISYLLFHSHEEFNHLSPEAKKYIESNFQRKKENATLWIKKLP